MNANGSSRLQNLTWQRLLIHWGIVWICSLLPPVGILLVLGAALSYSRFGGGDPQPAGYVLGLLFIFGSPLLLGLYFSPNWRGLLSGVLAIFWLLGIIGGHLIGLIHIPDPVIVISLLLMFAGAVIIILIVDEMVKTKTDFVGLGLGVVIGCLLAFFAMSGLPNRQGGQIIPAIPAIILSAILFPDILSRRTGWLSLLIVGAMLVATVVIVILGS